jgi:hypothetical protein
MSVACAAGLDGSFPRDTLPIEVRRANEGNRAWATKAASSDVPRHNQPARKREPRVRVRDQAAVVGDQLEKVFTTHEVGFDLHRRIREHLRLMVVERLPIVGRHVCDADHFILLSAGSSGAKATFCTGRKEFVKVNASIPIENRPSTNATPIRFAA